MSSNFATKTLNNASERPIRFNQEVISISGTPSRIQQPFRFAQRFTDCSIALANMYLYYSWYNIAAAYGNNVLSYQYPNGSGFNTYTITIPDGFYTIDTLGQFINSICLQNSTYLLNNGVIVYPFSIVTNVTYYRTQVTINAVPSSLPSGWTQPVGAPSLPTTNQWPVLIVPPTSSGDSASNPLPATFSISKFLGINPGSYPPAGTAIPLSATSIYNFLGIAPPKVEYTNSVNVNIDLANAGAITGSPQTVYQFSAAGLEFGSLITVEPKFPLYVPVTGGTYNYFTVYLTDDDDNALPIQDPHITGSFLVRGL